MGFLPYDAPAPAERSFENIARCTVDEIIRLGDAVGKPGRMKELPRSKDGRKTANPDDPYWDFVFETLDAKYASDGNPLTIILSTRLTDINGDWLDNRQRPYLTAQAFAGVGVRAVPFTAEVAARFPHLDMGIDASFDPTEIIGRSFRLRQSKITNEKGEQLGRDLYLPTERFDADYVYRGEVRLVQSKQGGVSGNGDDHRCLHERRGTSGCRECAGRCRSRRRRSDGGAAGCQPWQPEPVGFTVPRTPV